MIQWILFGFLIGLLISLRLIQNTAAIV